MKRLLLILLLLPAMVTLHAQQEAMFSFYDWNKMSLNPAVAGDNGTLNATLIHRSQWVGFEGAPITQSLTVDAPVVGDAVNLGLSVLNDKTGPVRNVGVMVDYAYRMKLSDNWKVALGLKAGFNDYVFDLGGVKTIDIDPVFTKSDNDFDLNIGIGAFASYKRLTFGFAVPKLIDNGFDYTVDGAAKEFRHYYMTASYDQPLNEHFTLRPTTLLKVTEGAPVEGDITLVCFYDNKYWIGVMGRSMDGVGLQCGIRPWKNCAIGYAFDWSIANTTGYTNAGSHEVMLHYEYDYRKRKRKEQPAQETLPMKQEQEIAEAPKDTIKPEPEPVAEPEEEPAQPVVEDEGDKMTVYKVTVVNFKNNAPIEGAEVRVGGFLEKETDSAGVAEFVFADEQFNVDVRALGYYNVRTTRKGSQNDTIYMTVMLNRRIVLKNIYYDFDKADLRAESVKELEKIVAFLKTNPDLKIELGSHTDSRGNDDYNMRLSERRAKSVVEYIISRGISPERIVSKGYGETQLVNDCGNGVKCTEEEHQQNRRTEILILEK